MSYFRKKIPVCFILLVFLLSVQKSRCEEPPRSVISLEGIWNFKPDLTETGIQSNGVQMFPSLPEKITLPGSTDEAGKGIRNQEMTSLRLTRLFEYQGPAWYEKEIYIPKSWKEKEVALFLERVHWETKLWVNGKYVGVKQSLSTPQVFSLTEFIRPGEQNSIRMRIDNSIIHNIEYSHAVSAETQTNWNGVVGRIEMQASDKVFLEDVQVFPDVSQKKVSLEITIGNNSGNRVSGKITAQCNTVDKEITVPEKSIGFEGRDSVIFVQFDLPLGDKIKTWDEFDPALYRLEISLTAGNEGGKYEDSKALNFGLRQLEVKGMRFHINGRESFIRGTVNCASFPLTGYPPTDEAAWERVMSTCKDYGLNSIRFHSWCPPKAAFKVADRLGLYLQVENSDWRFRVGEEPSVDAFLQKESEQILKEYGNHPSFMFFCEGNEMVGPKVKEFLADQVNLWKKDKRRLYTGSAAYPLIPENQFNVLYGARPHRWKEGLTSRFNAAPLNTLYDYSDYVQKYPVPMITHEIGQWCVYPNYEEISKYTGVLKPYNYQIFKESLREHHMLDLAKKFTMASGKFQVILKKEEFESYLRTPGMAGYHLLQLNDFPGQGTSPVGVVDVFWDPKPYVSAEEFREYQATRLPLLRTRSFVWTNDSVFEGTVEFANYGQSEMKRTVLQWKLEYPDGEIYAQGKLPAADIPLGSPVHIGDIEIPLKNVRKASQMKLVVGVKGTSYRNQWQVWVYPASLPEMRVSETIMQTSKWNSEAKDYLEQGGTVLLIADTADVKANVASCFSGISWNAVWSGMPPELLGILCNPEHPLFLEFPTDFHSNWHWWDLVMPSKPMNLDHTPPKFHPLVQMIPDWNKNNKLGLVLEAKVGNGKLLICSIDLTTEMDKRPVARQFLYSLRKYINSEKFNPQDVLTIETVDKLFE
jgi:hypothetical protein